MEDARERERERDLMTSYKQLNSAIPEAKHFHELLIIGVAVNSPFSFILV